MNDRMKDNQGGTGRGELPWGHGGNLDQTLPEQQQMLWEEQLPSFLQKMNINGYNVILRFCNLNLMHNSTQLPDMWSTNASKQSTLTSGTNRNSFIEGQITAQ